MRHLLLPLMVVLGVLALMLGNADDSPGLGGIGLLLLLAAVAIGARRAVCPRRARRSGGVR